MINVNYQKRKNGDLFKCLENPNGLFLSDLQNYVPIYTKFFSLNETNYNSINLNHPWYLSLINNSTDDNENNEYVKIYNCKLKNIDTNKIKNKDVFFKLAPLLDPYKYLIGRYNILDNGLFTLPKIETIDNNCHPKFMDTNNAAYVDGLFLFFSSKLLENHNFIHGVDYYGSFLGIKNNFVLNVFDDIDYLNDSDFFNKNKNILFKIDNYEHLFQTEVQKLKPINIQHDTSAKSLLSIQSFDNEIFENIFEENTNELNNSLSLELENISSDNILNNDDKTVTLRSSSTCSSRSSHTSIEDNAGSDDDNEDDDDDDDEDEDEDEDEDDDDDDDEDEEDDEEEDDQDEEDEEDEEEEAINVTIPKFPVQVICMENCENTFDDLILNSDLTKEEWYSAFMQIIMILITYQQAFNFTHNDLHTNNIMYIETNKKFIYYCYKKKYYKVPTFGRLFKIIDFGRSIYKFKGKLFCSDSFQIGGDAATQYNTEPYLNDKKPRLEPNYSFDLCRLACSIFDYIIDDIEEVRDLSKCDDPIKRLIVEWCLDDKGINMLYKNNGTDRYPDFKLYKMIARCVHNHTPQAQLERPEFNAFSNFKGEIPPDVINIDNIPVYV